MRKRDILALIALCVFVAASAGAAVRGGRMHAKSLMCSTNMKVLGAALSAYVDIYDGQLASLENTSVYPTWTQHFYLLRREYTPGNNLWKHWGCLYAAGLVADGRTFYCPAASGSIDEYISYCDPAPWGTLPQVSNMPPQGNGNQWVRATRGYLYWPQSTDTFKSNVSSEINSNAVGIYQVGCPKSATTLSMLDEGRAVGADLVYHDDGPYMANVLFWDGSVVYRGAPTASDGRKMQFNDAQQNPRGEAFASDWKRVTVAEWMYAMTK